MTDHAAEESAIQSCVRVFYDLVRADDLLGPVFNASVKNWPQHIKMMDDFWSGALLGTQRYSAAPFPPHLKLDMTQDHFDRWRERWVPTVQATLPEPIRARAISIAEQMSHCWGRAYTTMKSQMAQA